MRDINDYTQNYMQKDFEHTLVGYRQKKVLEILKKYHPKNILEIGCGMDSIFNYYKDYENFCVIEPSAEFCKIAKNSSNFNENITIINDFVENVNGWECNYDFVLISGLLHEVINPQELLKSIKQFCTKDTIIHINVPNSNSFHLVWAQKSGLLKNLGDKTPTQIRLQQNTNFNTESLEKMVAENGFLIIEKGAYFLKPFNHAKMQKLLDLEILDAALLDGLYELSDEFIKYCAEIYVNCKVC